MVKLKNTGTKKFTDAEQAFLDQLEQADRVNPSRKDDDQILARANAKMEIAKAYDKEYGTAYATDMNGFNANIMRLPVRHKFDLAIAAEVEQGRTPENLHERFDFMKDARAWEKGYNSVSQMEEAEYKRLGFFSRLKFLFGLDRDDEPSVEEAMAGAQDVPIKVFEEESPKEASEQEEPEQEPEQEQAPAEDETV